MIFKYNDITVKYFKNKPLYNTDDILRKLGKTHDLSQLKDKIAKDAKYKEYKVIMKYEYINSYILGKFCTLYECSFNNIIMNTINYNIKYHVKFEDLEITTINKDVYGIIMDYVYEMELLMEKKKIPKKIDFTHPIDSQYTYIHSLIDIKELIKIIIDLCRINYKEYFYSLAVINAKTTDLIYAEDGYNIKSSCYNHSRNWYSLETFISETLYDDSFIIHYKYGSYPTIYYKSLIQLYGYSAGNVSIFIYVY